MKNFSRKLSYFFIYTLILNTAVFNTTVFPEISTFELSIHRLSLMLIRLYGNTAFIMENVKNAVGMTVLKPGLIQPGLTVK